MSPTSRAAIGPALAIVTHALGVIEVVGVGLMIWLVAPNDDKLATYRSPLLLLAALTVVVGWILAWKRPRVPIGWLFLGVGLLGALQGPAVAIGIATQHAAPMIAGWAAEFGPESPWSWFPSTFVLLTLVSLRFPTGELPSTRWRWFWWSCVGLIVVGSALYATMERSPEFGVRNPTFVDWGPALAPLQDVLDASLLFMMLGSVASLFVRYRRGGVVERAQLRWLFWALVVVVGLLLVTGIENLLFGGEDTPSAAGAAAQLVSFISLLSYSLVPLAILFAVLRTGLYSIDRIISRTATYGLVTVLTIAVYAGVVLLGSLLVPHLQQIGVAAATLAAAALFLPLLRVVRRRLDRRFDRTHYDAEQVIERYGERVRNGAISDHAADDLVRTVQDALHPAGIGLWTAR